MRNQKPPHTKIPLTPFRRLIIDGLEVGRKKHYIKGFIELDVTEARQSIRAWRRDNKRSLSLLAFFAWCVANALKENRSLNAGLKNNHIVVFDDIDIAVAIEMDLNGEKVPRLMVVRESQNKSAQDIHDEIEAAQKINKEQGDIVQGDAKNIRLVTWLLRLPKFIRMALWNRLLRDPFFTKKMMGTVGVTSIGMFGSFAGWPEPLPSSNHTLTFALGGITKKPRYINDQLEKRDIWHVTVMLDHDIVDGAPAARFMSRLQGMVEMGMQGEGRREMSRGASGS